MARRLFISVGAALVVVLILSRVNRPAAGGLVSGMDAEGSGVVGRVYDVRGLAGRLRVWERSTGADFPRPQEPRGGTQFGSSYSPPSAEQRAADLLVDLSSVNR